MAELEEQINVVVEARARVQGAIECRTLSYQRWVEANQPLIDNESNTKSTCQEAEATLRALTLKAYTETGNKAPAPGVGIRELTILNYDSKAAFDWAKAHRMALKLDVQAFERIAKADPLDFVAISKEPQATIAVELVEIE